MEVFHAIRHGADYVGLGPYKFTTTKTNIRPTLGITGYNRIFELLNQCAMNIPIVAIGGIELEDVSILMEAKVSGVAVSGAILNAENISLQVQNFLKELNKN
jgi:thiamine-phosphate pyrophosphorylase